MNAWFVAAALAEVPFSHAPCNLTATFPGAPVEFPVPGSARARLAVGWVWEDTATRHLATLSCLQFPHVLAPDEARDLLMWSADALRGGVPGAPPRALDVPATSGTTPLIGLEVETPSWVGGYQSRIRSRWWSSGSFVYQLQISVPHNEKFTFEQVDFLDSFALLSANQERHAADAPLETAAWASPDGAWSLAAPAGGDPIVKERLNQFEGNTLPFQVATWALDDRDLSFGLRWVTLTPAQVAGRDAAALVDALWAEQAKGMQFEPVADARASVPGGASRTASGKMGAMAHVGPWPVTFRVVVIGDRAAIAVVHARESRFRASIADAFVESLTPGAP